MTNPAHAAPPSSALRIGYLLDAGVPDLRERVPTGPAHHVRHVVRELQALGHDVCVVARMDGGLWASDDLVRYRRIALAGIDDGARRVAERLVRGVQRRIRAPYLAWFESRRFAAACERELSDRDLLYERLGWMGLGGSLAATRLGVPHVLEVNGDLPTELEMNGCAPRPLQRAVSMRLMARLTRRATHAVATGDGWRVRHIEQWGVPPSRVSVIHNGSVLVDMLERSDLRSFREGPPPGAPLRVVFAGSFDPWQGLPQLLSAVGAARAAGTDVLLTLAGDGPQRAQLQGVAARLGLSNHVEFSGRLTPERLARCLAACDVGVSLYRGRVEFSGLKLLDYKAAGLATIAAGRDRQPTLIVDGETGVIVPPEDEGALCDAFRRMALDPGTRVRMGRRARLEAEGRHRWANTAQALERLFQRIVTESEAGAHERGPAIRTAVRN